jgi:hypothetical protein
MHVMQKERRKEEWLKDRKHEGKKHSNYKECVPYSRVAV